MTADKDALLKLLERLVNMRDSLERHGQSIHAEITKDAASVVRGLLTAPAEAPVPAVMQLPPLNEIIYHAVSGLELDFGSGEDSFKGTINDDTLDWIWESINTALRCANVPSSAAPLPQSAPVSREAVIEECAKVCEAAISELHITDDILKKDDYFKGVKAAIDARSRAIRALKRSS